MSYLTREELQEELDARAFERENKSKSCLHYKKGKIVAYHIITEEMGGKCAPVPGSGV